MGEDGIELPHRHILMDQVVQTALPDTKNPDEVSTIVKAFMANNEMTKELIELLDHVLLQSSSSAFRDNKNLQNLLILTAIKEESACVMIFLI